MKKLIQHLVENNFDEILSLSLLNCHCIGLHSIMLLESPGKTIRLYVAEPGHEMWRNLPKEVESFWPVPNHADGLSIAFHPHHCNLTLQCVKGKVVNWIVKAGDKDDPNATNFPIGKYLYRSKINEGEMSFEALLFDLLQTDRISEIRPGGDCVMKANDIHTVGCYKNEFAAWLVYEGQEDPTYKSYCWSNLNLNQKNSEGLYQKPTTEKILELLTQCDLL